MPLDVSAPAEPRPDGTLSVVIPTLNAADTLARTLLGLADADEVIVVDGGSSDRTTDLATSLGAKVLLAPRGRGWQLHRGACEASGPWLLFLHADTELAPDWPAAARAFMKSAQARGRAATFRFALDDPDWRARVLERLVALRVRLLAMPYGDQGLLIHRELYRAVGGFRPLPLMEDVDLARRLGRRRLTQLPAAARTSARRWREDGWLARSARNVGCLLLYTLGVPADRIARLYGR